jgi:sulfite exporter TauE/SafE
MTLPLLTTAFTLGLFGSLHCVGMCGPLMLAAGVQRDWRGAVSYQAGRILVYSLIGFLLGALGWGVGLHGAQSGLAIASGVLLVVVGVLRLQPEAWLLRWPGYGRFLLTSRKWIARAAAGRSGWTRFGLGCCNGILPCGLVYVAAVGAANAGGAVAGGTFMLAFGAGTLPLLAVLLLSGRRLEQGVAGRLLRLAPVLVVGCGLLLIWRGWSSYLPMAVQRWQDLAHPVMCW